MKTPMVSIVGIFAVILASQALAANLVDILPEKTHLCGCETTQFQVVVNNPYDYGKGYILNLKSNVEDWISLKPTSLVVNQNSSETLSMYIAVPCDAKPGTYDVGLLLESYDVSDTEDEQFVVRDDCTINVPITPERPWDAAVRHITTPTGLEVAASGEDFLKLGGAAILLVILIAMIIMIRK